MFVFVFVRQSDSFITVIAARNGALAKIRITIHSHIVSRTSFFSLTVSRRWSHWQKSTDVT